MRPVLIAGGGLTGLSAAAFLAWHGVPALLVERRAGALAHPRARAVTPRTVELYRRLGIEPAILAACTYELGEDSLLVRAETLAAPEQHRTSLEQTKSSSISPCAWATIAQDRLEEIVRARAVDLGAEIRFGTELTEFTEHPTHIEATLSDNTKVTCQYLIAADGHRSPIRHHLGIKTPGPGTLGHTATFLFRADLDKALRGRRIDIANLDHPRPGTVLLRHDDADGWVLSIPFDPTHGEALTDFDAATCAAAVQAMSGLDDLAIELVPQLSDGTTVLGYEIGAHIAEHFREGRVFLAGDAAHIMPPSGALGASTGIQDAHNLAWKLAAVLNGTSTPRLLDTYDAERRPVAHLTLAQALHEMRVRTGRSIAASAEAPGYEAAIFGYRYGPGKPVHPEALNAQPGTRAPHIELNRSGERISSLDLYGPDYTLLTTPAGAHWAKKTERPDIRTHVIGEENLTDPHNTFHERHNLPPDGAVLVRPDGFVAWHSSEGEFPNGR